MTLFKDLPAKEQGIDTSREFIVINGDGASYYETGDILELVEDDDTPSPKFKSKSDGKERYCSWCLLAYASIQPDKVLHTNQNQDTKDAKIAKIIEWLYVNGDVDDFECTKDWREAFLKMLNEVI